MDQLNSTVIKDLESLQESPNSLPVPFLKDSHLINAPLNPPSPIPLFQRIPSDPITKQEKHGLEERSNSLFVNKGESAPVSPHVVVSLQRLPSDPITKREKSRLEKAISNSLFVKSFSGSTKSTSIKSSKSLKLFKKSSSSLLNLSVIPTFYCGICLENCPKSDSFSPSCCDLHHEFCSSCSEGWCGSQISEGVISISCPNFKDCSSSFSDEEVLMLVSEDVYAKYSRFKRVKQDPNYRECPQCNHGDTFPPPACLPVPPSRSTLFGLGARSDPSQIVFPNVLCGKCSSVFCTSHSNAHPGVHCEEYLRQLGSRLRAEMNASDALVKREAKPCPKCKASTMKNGGCNHMTCQSCRANWCWLCGRETPDVSAHYQVGNIFGCPGAQFSSEDPLSICCRYLGCCSMAIPCHFINMPCLLLPLRILMYFILYLLLSIPFIIVGSVSFAMGCAFAPVCLPTAITYSYCKHGTFEDVWDVFVSFLGYPVLSITYLVAGLLGLIILLIWFPFAGLWLMSLLCFDSDEEMMKILFYPVFIVSSFFSDDD